MTQENEPKKTHILSKNEKYLIQLIDGRNGTRSPAFVSDPVSLCDYLAEDKRIDTTIHVVVLMSKTMTDQFVESEDLEIGFNDIIMDVPVYSSRAWIATFNPSLLPAEVTENV